MITLKWEDVGMNEKVFLDNRFVGVIKKIDGRGWQYFPAGQKEGGEIFKRISNCEKSLSV